jgi:ubiquinone/menaquinone biosynthesis C-methylase UbiE
MQGQTEDYYSSIAPSYDELYGAEQEEKLQEFLKRASLPSRGKMLDVGCGTGKSIASFPGWDWHGIEPAQGLIDHADIDTKPKIILGKGESLPFPDAHFDMVLSLTALQNYDDPEQGLLEMRRVLNHDGKILLSFLKKSEKKELLDQIIRKQLHILDAWESAKDMMYVCVKE